MAGTCRLRWVAMTFGAALAFGCGEIPRGSTERNDLGKMPTATVQITGRTSYTVYVAADDATRQLGLMNVTETDLPADRGMLFVFPRDQVLAFWMRNTLIPLDIAYIRSDGVIVKTYTMTALDEVSYPSIEKARFALEVRAGQFREHRIVPGDRVEIPEDLRRMGS